MQGEIPAPIERFLALVERVVASRHDRRAGLFWRLIRGLRLLADLAIGGYLVALVVVLGVLAVVGERHPVTALALYGPGWLWFLPAIPLAFVALIFRWRWFWAAPVMIVAAISWLGWEVPIRAESGGDITLVANNRGNRNSERLTPFVEKHDADLIVMQEARFRGPSYERQYKPQGFAVAHAGEYVTISRWPILTSDLLRGPDWNGRPYPVALRTVVDTPHGRIALYNVHMPSPRDVIEAVAGSPTSRDSWERLAQHTDQHLAIAAYFREVLDAEPLPALVAGDFNMADKGWLYRTFRRGYRDAFDEKGTGRGETFPGGGGLKMRLVGPWLRLDYIFADKEAFRIEAFDRENNWKVQHRAIAATVSVVGAE